MKKKILGLLIMAITFTAYGKNETTALSEEPKLIAVVNRADWCLVCRQNQERFSNLLGSYVAKGIKIYVNDLTNDSTKANSKAELQKAGLYDAVTTTPRKGAGKVLQACGLAKGKKVAGVSGIVTFINPDNFKPVGQTSIADSDVEMKTLIDNLLIK
ncbi:MAG: hypothetical protein EOP00_21210 [Pedobacter sp.]|nr:MAG: hypothetical protein EOP00_21210 [Pedobacter sp.]